MVLQGANHLQSGAVAHVREARVTMAAEVPLENSPVLRAIEHRAPGFQLAHSIRSFFRVQFGHAPLVEILSAAHGVREMDAPVVAVIDVGQSGGNPPFGHHRVRLAQQRFAHHAHPQAGRCRFYRRPKARSARADNQNIVRMPLVLGH